MRHSVPGRYMASVQLLAITAIRPPRSSGDLLGNEQAYHGTGHEPEFLQIWLLMMPIVPSVVQNATARSFDVNQSKNIANCRLVNILSASAWPRWTTAFYCFLSRLPTRMRRRRRNAASSCSC